MSSISILKYQYQVSPSLLFTPNNSKYYRDEGVKDGVYVFQPRNVRDQRLEFRDGHFVVEFGGVTALLLGQGELQRNSIVST